MRENATAAFIRIRIACDRSALHRKLGPVLHIKRAKAVVLKRRALERQLTAIMNPK